MKINSLKLVNFRNYNNLNISFGNKINIIFGNNGVGKTNLIEAIYVLALTKSFRTNNDKNLIKYGELSTKIEGEVEKETVDKYQIIINKEGKKVRINNNLKIKISDYVSNLNVILLQPDEQIIFDDSPSDRRRLLNIEISQLNNNYLLLLNDYNRILKQRNFYLREVYINGNKDLSYLDIITEKLIKYGIKINEQRKDFINRINLNINNWYNKIFDYGDLLVNYISDYNDKTEEDIKKLYKKNYNREVIAGKTLIGIHHDDIRFMLDNKNIADCGSNGQRKNAILSFKLSEIDIFVNEKKDYPILILDDLFSALDNNKIKNILKYLNGNIQIFITMTDLDRINYKELKNIKLFKSDNNSVEEAI